MEFTDYLVAIRRHWRAFAAIICSALLVAGVASLAMPKVYTASASGLVTAGATEGLAQASISDNLAKSRVKSYLDVARSRAVAERVVSSLQLSTTSASLIGHVSITQPADTVLINVSATAATPEGASELADAWVYALAEQVASIENPNGQSKQALRVVPVEAAALPAAPSSPRPAVNIALGALLGLLLALGYVVLAARMDRRLRTPDDVTRLFDVTVAGTIPQTPDLIRAKSGELPIAVSSRALDVALGPAAEAFRKLRTSLRFMHIDRPPRIIVVTSPLPGDGKSTIAGNLAAALAVAGTPTVLVDADLRRPVVASSFGLDPSGGLSNLLVGDAEFCDVAVQSPISKDLVLLPSGTIPPNPSEMLGSGAMKRLLDALAERYVVILDAPPLLPVADAAVLTARADGALIVISEGQTTDSQLAGALEQLSAVSGSVLGVVINKAAKLASRSSYYGGYYAPVAKTAVVETAGPMRQDREPLGATRIAS